MANKNRTGNLFNNWKKQESHLINQLEKRDENRNNAENVDPVYNKYEVSSDGSKVWSF